MRYCQYLILEASPACNLAADHPACPTSDPRRFAGLNTANRLDEATMIDLAVRMHLEHGFRGLVGFHYYNEPLLSREKILRVIAGIRERAPAARFVLWTNGTKIAPENAAELSAFEQIHVTNYQRRDFAFLDGLAKQVSVFIERFDHRRVIGATPSHIPCLRPWTEFIVDFHGHVHVCCTDWSGRASPGNVFVEALAVLVARYQQIRDQVAGPYQMSEAAPQACLTCGCRWPTLSRLVPEIALDAQQELQRRNRS